MRAVRNTLVRTAIFAGLALSPVSVGWGQTALGINLENPRPNARVSGISVVSGWTCKTGVLEISFDGGTRIRVPSGGTRGDTAGVCGRADTGFGLLLNYNIFGSGDHTLQLFIDGVAEGGPVPFTVTRPAGEFLRNVVKSLDVPNFPAIGQTTRLDWQESIQNFAIVGTTGGAGFQPALDTFPIQFGGIRLLGVSFAVSFGDCDMTVRFQNTGTVSLDPFLYFDIVQGGIATGQEIFAFNGIQPGVIAEDTTTVLAGGKFLDCGTFQVRFNSAASKVFD
jgi:hypothetical protein